MTTIPTLKQLYEAYLQDLQVELGISIPLWKKTFIRALAMVQAGKLKLAYLALANVQKNVFPDLAAPESAGGTLERFGRVKLGRGPQPATQGKYFVTVSGDPGAVIPVSTTFKSNDDATNPGILYILDGEVVMNSPVTEIEVRALTAGTEGRQNAGDRMTLTAPILGISNEAIVTAESVIPNAAETTEEYRRVVLESFRMMPQGGAPSDYRIWAQDASGVKQSYPYAASGRTNEVDVYIEASAGDSIDGHGTPTSTILSDAESVIEQDPVTGQGRRPLGVFKVNVWPVEACAVDIEIPNFQNRTLQTEQIIEAALEELTANIRPFIAGADVVTDRNDLLSVNIIIATILAALPGSAFATPVLKITVGGVQYTYSEYLFDYGKIPYLNSVSYV